eukprot:11752819-Alexandrium_andersonii.AAC.1
MAKSANTLCVQTRRWAVAAPVLRHWLMPSSRQVAPSLGQPCTKLLGKSSDMHSMFDECKACNHHPGFAKYTETRPEQTHEAWSLGHSKHICNCQDMNTDCSGQQLLHNLRAPMLNYSFR